MMLSNQGGVQLVFNKLKYLQSKGLKPGKAWVKRSMQTSIEAITEILP